MLKKDKYVAAVVGAAGAVGEEMISYCKQSAPACPVGSQESFRKRFRIPKHRAQASLNYRL